MKKLIVKEWEKLKNGKYKVRWYEWDGACLCSFQERTGEVEAAELTTKNEVKAILQAQIYGYYTRDAGAV